MASKNFTSKKADFAKGGSTKMFGKQHTGPQKASVTAHSVGGNGKFAAGGNTKMHAFAPAGAARAGITSVR